MRDDEKGEIRQAAKQFLSSRSAFPNVIKAVAAQLEDKDWYVQQVAEATLRKQQDFYHNLLNGPHVMSFYRILLQLSFDKNPEVKKKKNLTRKEKRNRESKINTQLRIPKFFRVKTRKKRTYKFTSNRIIEIGILGRQWLVLW